MTPLHPDIAAYSKYMSDSHARWLGKPLAEAPTPQALAQALYEAPFALLSHGIEPDPLFCYANRKAQELWGYGWKQFIGMPSRLSAEPDAREVRQQLLDKAARQGYADDYSGIRIARDGRRFRIDNCVLYNVMNETGDKIGQAATFSSWHWL